MKIGIIGTGFIIREALTAMSEVPEIELAAILARPHSIEKGRAFAGEFGIHKVYTDYDKLLADPEIDTVYIGIINSVHYRYGKKALLADKNVIMEKPFTGYASQAQELADLARGNNRFLFEAVTCRNCQVFDRMRESLPLIGNIRLVQANYSQFSSRYARYLKHDVAPVFDLAACGGALYDLNIYNFSMAVALLGEPEDVRYLPNLGWNGVDTSGIATLKYRDFVCVLTAAKDSDSPSHFTIQGENGWIQIPDKPNERERLLICIKGREPEEFVPAPEKNRLVQEFRIFSRAIMQNDRAFMERELDISLAVMRTVERARVDAGIQFPAES
ncbi:MAG: Gfo/Idh/MocA family oxidoreductase [Eubacteriales bacterium]|nr:Gfo/Idh/MocA family oxidoreductase [Eubacteriales bacterium]